MEHILWNGRARREMGGLIMHSGPVASWQPRLQAVCLEEGAKERRSQGRPAGVPLIALMRLEAQ